MNKKIVNHKPVKLDGYERELEKDFAASIPLTGKEASNAMEKLKTAAQSYRRKGKRITIRVYESDLEMIKQLAFTEGLPYQTFITSVLHKLSTGYLRSSTGF